MQVFYWHEKCQRASQFFVIKKKTKQRRKKKEKIEKNKLNRWMNAPFYISDRLKLYLCNHISLHSILNGTESHIFLFLSLFCMESLNFIRSIIRKRAIEQGIITTWSDVDKRHKCHSDIQFSFLTWLFAEDRANNEYLNADTTSFKWKR